MRTNVPATPPTPSTGAPPGAATVRNWVTGTLTAAPGARVVVTGGLNDTVQAATQILLGPPGSEIGTAGFREADQGNPQRLWNLARLMPAGNDNSRINQGRHELIDHILVSADLVQPLDAIHVEAVIDQPLVETVSPARRNILTRAGDRRPGTGRTLLQLPNGGG